MARHRDIRNMDYEDEYDGYDDIYGHSIDDDYYISPSNRQFIYNRETSRDARLEPADDIPEVDTIDELSDTDRVRLESCLDEIKNTLGPSKVSRGELINLVLRHNYNVELVINAILEDPKYQNKIGDKEKDDTCLLFSKVINPDMKPYNESIVNKERTNFQIPSFSMSKLSSSPKPFVIPRIFDTTKEKQSGSPNKSNIFKSELTKKSLEQTGSPKNFTIPNIFSSKSEGNCSITGSPAKLFNIPNIFRQNEQPSDQPFENGMQVDEENFYTLSDLVSSHLKNNISLSEVPLTNPQNCTDTDIDSVSKKICTLKVVEQLDISKSVLSSELKNNFNIDLSKALKPTGSLPNILKNKKNKLKEKFDIPFIDSDILMNKDAIPKVIKKTLLPCNMDISRNFDISKKYGKRPSRLGKVLGRKYKHTREGVFHLGMHFDKTSFLTAVKVFHFNTQSPDDYILSHLQR